MTISAYSTAQMLSLVEHMPSPSTFWLNLAFKEQINFTDATIDFDKIKGGRRIAPFVAPTVQGKVMRDLGYDTKSFVPAYLKPKHVVDPSRLLTRKAGEPYGGSMTPAQRRDVIIADNVKTQKEMIIRRWELMAAEAILDGVVTVSGDDYDTKVVDFGRDPGQSVTLTGTDRWSDSTSKPYQDLEAWSVQTSRLCGYAIRDWILGSDAWNALMAHPDTKDLLDRNIANGGATLQAGPGNIPDDGAIVELKGTVGVGIRIWTYQDIYDDDDGNPVEVMPSDCVVGINPAGLRGVRCFGAILDAQAGFQAQEIFAKDWFNEDPSVEYVMSQSAPLMVPKEANATVKAVVV